MNQEIPKVFVHTLQMSISKLALGGLPFGWTINTQKSHRLLDAFSEAGGNLIDTADNYSAWVAGHVGGESERVIGSWLRKRRLRHKVLVATKVGYETSLGCGLGQEHIMASADASLARLDTDYIDIYQLHCADPDTPVEETVEALAKLQQRKTIRAVGFCNMPAGTLCEYLQAAKEVGLECITTFQGKLNYLERDRVSEDLFKLIRESKLIFLAYGVLARGFLTGKYTRVFDPATSVRSWSVYRKYYSEHFFRQLDVFLADARAKEKSPVEAAYEWVDTELPRNGVTPIIIGGFTSEWQLSVAVEALRTYGDGQRTSW